MWITSQKVPFRIILQRKLGWWVQNFRDIQIDIYCICVWLVFLLSNIWETWALWQNLWPKTYKLLNTLDACARWYTGFSLKEQNIWIQHSDSYYFEESTKFSSENQLIISEDVTGMLSIFHSQKTMDQNITTGKHTQSITAPETSCWLVLCLRPCRRVLFKKLLLNFSKHQNHFSSALFIELPSTFSLGWV